MKNGINYYEEYKTIQQIEKHLDNARDLVNSLPDNLQFELSKYHTIDATLLHCTRWGLQAAEDILKDWSKITAQLEKWENS